MNPNVREQPICIPGMDDRHRVGAGAFTSPLEAHTREGAQRVEESPVSDAARAPAARGPSVMESRTSTTTAGTNWAVQTKGSFEHAAQTARVRIGIRQALWIEGIRETVPE